MSRVSTASGIMLDVDRWRVGATANLGIGYAADRSAEVKHQAVMDTTYYVRQPAYFSGGVSYRASNHVRLAAQADYVRYSEGRPAAEAGVSASNEDFSLQDEIEPRVGIEVSLPLQGKSVQLRGGIASRAAGRIRYTGSDAALAATWMREEGVVEKSIGASLVARQFKIDVAGVFGQRVNIIAGATLYIR
jgi:hypothetical protein